MPPVLSPYLAESIGNWASDFPGSDEGRAFPPEARAQAPAVLAAFLTSACERAGGDLHAVEARHLQAAFLEDLPRLPVPAEAAAAVPGMVRAFLVQLEDAGRLAGGREAGAGIAAAGPGYLRAVGGTAETVRRPGAKIGRNDPCPCGSGRKYKACCL